MVVKAADPPVRVESPSLAVPAAKVTVPVGTPSPDTGLTWAVKTVELPTTGVVELTDSTVVVAASDGCETDEECIAEPQPAASIKPESVTTQIDSKR